MTYLVLGTDPKFKKDKIAELRQQVLTSSDTLQFDYDVLYAAKLDPDTLKKALLNLPAVAQQRVIVVHDCHELKAPGQEVILNFLNSKYDHNVLILESDRWTAEDTFVGKLKDKVKIFSTAVEVKENVFAMTRAMERRQDVQALQILHDLFEQGDHPLQIMGGLVWFWGKLKERLSWQRFEEGLLALQETDISIKRSRLDAQYAVEVLVVKLCSILR